MDELEGEKVVGRSFRSALSWTTLGDVGGDRGCSGTVPTEMDGKAIRRGGEAKDDADVDDDEEETGGADDPVAEAVIAAAGRAAAASLTPSSAAMTSESRKCELGAYHGV